MASSSYYWGLHGEKKAEAKKYRKNKEKMEDIQASLDRDFNNNVSDVNKRLNECGENLAKGVRHVSSISNRLDELTDFREEEPDGAGAVSELRDLIAAEVRALRQKEEDAEREADRYRELAQQAEAEEREARAARAAAIIKGMVGGG